MALSLALSYDQSNDATYLTLTDATGETATGGWGVSGNETYTDIVAGTDTTTSSKYHLLLDISVTDKDGTVTEYDQINLYDLSATNGTTVPYAAITDLVWTITAADLVYSGTAMGTSADRLTDGIYDITYTLASNSDHSTEVDSLEQKLLIDGDIRADVYDALREISRQYDNEVNDESKEIMEALLKYAYLLSIDASATVSEETNLINMLWTLDKLNSDGSKYSW